MPDESNLSTFGGRLRAAREGREMTQAQLAEQMGTTNSVVSRWETNQGGMPRHATAELMGVLLGVEPAWLMFGTGRRNAATRGLKENVSRKPRKRLDKPTVSKG